MRSRRAVRLVPLLAVLLISCGGSSDAAPAAPLPIRDAKSPVIASVTPFDIIAGADALVTITGKNFHSDASVFFIESSYPLMPSEYPMSTSFLSESKVTFTFPSHFQVAGSSLFRLLDGGGMALFSINLQNPVPVVINVTPSAVPAGTYRLDEVTVSGNGFAKNISAESSLASIAISRQWVDWTELYLLPDYTKVGSTSITLTNPSPGGGSSAPFPFEVFPVVPSYSALEVFAAPKSNLNPYDPSLESRIFGNGRYLLNHFRTQVSLVDTCLGADDSCEPSEVTKSETPTAPLCDSSMLVDNSGRFYTINSLCYELLGTGIHVLTAGARIYDDCLGATSACQPSLYVPTLPVDGLEKEVRVGAISGNGRRIVISSDIDQLAPLYVAETCLGAPGPCTRSTEPATVTPNADLTRGIFPAISANGRFLIFTSDDSELVFPAAQTLAPYLVFVRDTCFEAPAGCNPSNFFISAEDSPLKTVAVDSSGRYVRVAQTLFDTCRDIANCTSSYIEVTTDTLIPDGARSLFPERSSDGRFVVFTSFDKMLVPNDTNYNSDAYLYDNCFGATNCVKQIRRYSVTDPGIQLCGESAAITPNGEYLFYTCNGSLYRVKRDMVLP